MADLNAGTPYRCGECKRWKPVREIPLDGVSRWLCLPCALLIRDAGEGSAIA